MLIINPIFLQYCTKPKYQFLFHKNYPACDLYVMTLTTEQNIKRPAAFKSHQSKYQESCKKVCMSNNIDYSSKLCMYVHVLQIGTDMYELYKTLLSNRSLTPLMIYPREYAYYIQHLIKCVL